MIQNDTKKLQEIVALIFSLLLHALFLGVLYFIPIGAPSIPQPLSYQISLHAKVSCPEEAMIVDHAIVEAPLGSPVKKGQQPTTITKKLTNVHKEYLAQNIKMSSQKQDKANVTHLSRNLKKKKRQIIHGGENIKVKPDEDNKGSS